MFAVVGDRVCDGDNHRAAGDGGPVGNRHASGAWPSDFLDDGPTSLEILVGWVGGRRDLGRQRGLSNRQYPWRGIGHRVTPTRASGPDAKLILLTVSGDTVLLRHVCIIVIGLLAAIVVLIGRYQFLQRALTVLVVAMSGMFLLAAIISRPSLAEIGRGLIPSLPVGGEWIVIGLIGTTVVPYNLFLHASLAANQWPNASKDSGRQANFIRQSRRDTILSVALGGVVTAAILLTAANAFSENRADGGSVSNVGDIARQLEPAIGSAAKWLFAIGLFAAGLTSAITAPIAAGYAAAGCFGWPNMLSDWRLKSVALLVIATGVVCGLVFGASPQETIILAQVANGILLPLLAILLLVAVNRKPLMSDGVNNGFQNIVAVIVIAIVLLIAARQLKSVYEKLLPAKPVVACRATDFFSQTAPFPLKEAGQTKTAFSLRCSLVPVAFESTFVLG